MTINDIKIKKEVWATTSEQFGGYDYIAPDKTAWNVDRVDGNMAHLWQITGTGQTIYKAVNVYEFAATYRRGEAPEIAANDKNLLPELDIDAVNQVIFEYFKGRLLWDHNRKSHIIRKPDHLFELFGLGYTSSSEFAGLWNTNSDVEYKDGFYIKGFAVTRSGQVVMLTKDVNENWRYYAIGNAEAV